MESPVTNRWPSVRFSRNRTVGTISTVLLASLCVAPLPAFGQNLTVTHATLIDGTGAAEVPDVTVVVRDGRIAEIAASGSSFTASGEVIDLGGRYLLPGLIDGHAHAMSPDAAERALHSGVTTIRVMGDRNLQALGTRELIGNGHVPGAELLVSGDIVRPKPGMAFFVTFPQFGEFAGTELRGAATIAAVVRALLDRGVDRCQGHGLRRWRTIAQRAGRDLDTDQRVDHEPSSLIRTGTTMGGGSGRP